MDIGAGVISIIRKLDGDLFAVKLLSAVSRTLWAYSTKLRVYNVTPHLVGLECGPSRRFTIIHDGCYGKYLSLYLLKRALY